MAGQKETRMALMILLFASLLYKTVEFGKHLLQLLISTAGPLKAEFQLD